MRRARGERVEAAFGATPSGKSSFECSSPPCAAVLRCRIPMDDTNLLTLGVGGLFL